MRLLVACEESQRVCAAFRDFGHESYSCDIEPCSGGHPEWHIMGDVLPLLDGRCSFRTMDGKKHVINGRWDMIIAHPPCTYLTICANRSYSPRFNTPEQIAARKKLRDEAVEFFMKFVHADCDKIVIENPVGYINTHWKKPKQIIHPYYFADSVNDTENYHQKKTCLWMKGVNPLERKNNLPKPEPKFYSNGTKTKGKPIGWCEGMGGTKEQKAKARSKTFPGVAKAMAEQWGWC